MKKIFSIWFIFLFLSVSTSHAYVFHSDPLEFRSSNSLYTIDLFPGCTVDTIRLNISGSQILFILTTNHGVLTTNQVSDKGGNPQFIFTYNRSIYGSAYVQ